MATAVPKSLKDLHSGFCQGYDLRFSFFLVSLGFIFFAFTVLQSVCMCACAHVCVHLRGHFPNSRSIHFDHRG